MTPKKLVDSKEKFLYFVPVVTEKVALVLKNWFQPANGVRSTHSLVKIHNRYVCYLVPGFSLASSTFIWHMTSSRRRKIERKLLFGPRWINMIFVFSQKELDQKPKTKIWRFSKVFTFLNSVDRSVSQIFSPRSRVVHVLTFWRFSHSFVRLFVCSFVCLFSTNSVKQRKTLALKLLFQFHYKMSQQIWPRGKTAPLVWKHTR